MNIKKISQGVRMRGPESRRVGPTRLKHLKEVGKKGTK